MTAIERNKRNNRTRKNNKIIIYAGIASLTIFILLYIYFAVYYKNHFYKNTTINGVSVSDMTGKQAEDAINSQVKSYVLTLSGRNGETEKIKGEDIGLHAVFNGDIDKLLNKQNNFAWPILLTRKSELVMNKVSEYDDSLFKKVFNNLKCFDKNNIKEPENAYISEYGKNGYEIVPEKKGTKILTKKLYQSINKSILSFDPNLNLEKIDCYVKPEVFSDNPKLVDAVNKLNKIAGSRITYEFGDVTEVVDGKRISEWLSVNKDYQVSLDTEGIKEFVDYIGKNYNSFGRIRTFKTSYGKTLKIKGGDYGWWLNRGEEVKELEKLVLDGKQQQKEPVYYQKARQYGQDDIGNTYVEVNLTAQHLFFYKDSKLVLQTDIVSGNLAKKFGTPTGTYPIQYKENDATLNGEDYSTPVKYWMPFNGNIGLHDASWRDEFGKDIFLKSGSHGCINMSPAAAKKVFENISKGVAVVVYKLPGTENYEKDNEKEKNLEKKEIKVKQ
jgi:hypothetical protein